MLNFSEKVDTFFLVGEGEMCDKKIMKKELDEGYNTLAVVRLEPIIFRSCSVLPALLNIYILTIIT